MDYPSSSYLLRAERRLRFLDERGRIDRDSLRLAKYIVPYSDAFTDAQRDRLTKALGRLEKVWAFGDVDDSGLLVDFHGIQIVIDRPKGYVQTGVGADGVPWSRTYQVPYGFIPMTIAPDGDELDVYVGPDLSSPRVWVVTQIDREKRLDEFKLLVGFSCEREAVQCYLDHTPSWCFGGMTEIHPALLHALLGIEHPALMMALQKAAPVDADALAKMNGGNVVAEYVARRKAQMATAMARLAAGETVNRIWKTDPVAAAEWSTAYVNTLPDSAFLYIAPGGEKDADGKTVPRDLRYFPVRDADGRLDLPHLRNALARIPQANVPQAAKDRATAEAQRLLEEANAEAVTTASADQKAAKTAMVTVEVRGDGIPALKEVIAGLRYYGNVGASGPVYFESDGLRLLSGWDGDGNAKIGAVTVDGEPFDPQWTEPLPSALAKPVPDELMERYRERKSLPMTVEMVGYFRGPNDVEGVQPTDNRCPLCGEAWTPDNVRTHSILGLEGQGHGLSLFYRTHITCAEAVGDGIVVLDEQVFALAESIQVDPAMLAAFKACGGRRERKSADTYIVKNPLAGLTMVRPTTLSRVLTAMTWASASIPPESRPVQLARIREAVKAASDWSGYATPLASVPELANHPATTAPLSNTYTDPAHTGGWLGWIEPDDGSWIAFVDVGGHALLWTEREESGAVIGNPYSFERPDLIVPNTTQEPPLLTPDDVESQPPITSKSAPRATLPSRAQIVHRGDGVVAVTKAPGSAVEGKRLVYSVVLEPYPRDGMGDSQGHTYTEEDVEDACHFYAGFLCLNDQHGAFIPPHMATVVENFIAPCDYVLGQQTIKRGTWMMVVKFFDDALWAKVESGEFGAFSIEGYSTHQPLSSAEAQRLMQAAAV